MDYEDFIVKTEADDEIIIEEREIKPSSFEPQPKPLLKCTLCGKSTKDLIEHHANSHFTCNVCSVICNNLQEYKQHRKTHERLLHNIVINCDTSSDSEADLEPASGTIELNDTTAQERESRKIDELFNVDCTLPWSDSENEAEAKDEEEVEDFVGLLKSRVKSVFANSSNSATNKTTFACNYCREYVKGNSLKKHNAEFHQELVCEICGAFINCRRFGYHQDLHTERYKCEVCNKVFAKQCSLDVHSRMEHTGQTIRTCEICGKGFFTVKHFNIHVARHSKVLNYTCNLCQKKFFNSFALRSHMRQHTDERPYQCECGEAFKHNVSLKAHKKSKHGIVEEKKLQCKHCDKKFASYGARLTHMRKHH